MMVLLVRRFLGLPYAIVTVEQRLETGFAFDCHTNGILPVGINERNIRG